jgi:hypothetical protein
VIDKAHIFGEIRPINRIEETSTILGVGVITEYAVWQENTIFGTDFLFKELLKQLVIIGEVDMNKVR